jgi:hypothetical protein
MGQVEAGLLASNPTGRSFLPSAACHANLNAATH